MSLQKEEIEKEKNNTQLKTLKDIAKFYDLGGEILSRVEHPEIKGLPIIISQAKKNRKVFLAHLKAEAVKWVKNHGEELEKWSEGKIDIESNQWIRHWIQHFFNLKGDEK